VHVSDYGTWQVGGVSREKFALQTLEGKGPRIPNLPREFGPGVKHLLVKGFVAFSISVRLDLGPPAASAAVCVARRWGSARPVINKKTEP
jgi:hypothetical protein